MRLALMFVGPSRGKAEAAQGRGVHDTPARDSKGPTRATLFVVNIIHRIRGQGSSR